MEDKEFLSTIEAARVLGVSRITVFNKIKKGQIKAVKIGRNFVIRKQDVLEASGAIISEDNKRVIEKVVDKATNEYKEAFQKLGNE
ncbi:MAG: helix-turn-helix domain-containing protein [Patescibacteria group bacterium]|nr:helix-turn-helix domain-containing protein [Patescibacteria group bacterium]MCL5224057.1 helix-turn-helix domain-containing protein [Patescibacteria group bacterium]